MANPKKKTRRKWLILIGLILIALAGSGYAWFRKKEVPIIVTAENAARRNLTEIVVANGKIQPVLQVVINPEVSGEITDLPVKEGQHVKKGDLLLKIKPENYQAARNSAEASYKSALASKSLAEANLRKEEIEHKRARDLEEMEARVDIGEVDVVLIGLGQTARLEVEAFRDRKFKGIVTEIANSSKLAAPGQGSSSSSSSGGSSQEATKFEVKIRIQEKEIFRPGMSVTADIETRYRTNVITVPIQSVTTRVPKKPDDKNQPPGKTKTPALNSKEAKEAQKPVEVVFAVETDHVKMVPVKRGISDDAYVEIT